MHKVRRLTTERNTALGEKLSDFRATITSLVTAVEELQARPIATEQPKKHYLVQWTYWNEDSEFTDCKVGWFTDEELEKFCKNRDHLRITYLG